jgi:hypothetical protein
MKEKNKEKEKVRSEKKRLTDKFIFKPAALFPFLAQVLLSRPINPTLASECACKE